MMNNFMMDSDNPVSSLLAMRRAYEDIVLIVYQTIANELSVSLEVRNTWIQASCNDK